MDRILSKERFLLFPQRYFLGNAADLLHFMLHRVLSLTSVKNVCCHNAIPQTLIDELTCGSFQLSTWRLTITLIVFWFSSLREVGANVDRRYHHSVSSWKARQKSDFGENFSQRVTFWIKNFTTCQILNWIFYNASEFELKKLWRVRFWRKVFFKSKILKKKLILKSTFLKNKIIFKKQILKKFVHTKNHVLIHFTP